MAQKSILYKGNRLDISYEILNPNAKLDFIVLHGWGSNKNLMKQVFSPYMKGLRHIYIDLPGFGNSTACCAMQTEDVADIIKIFLQEIDASSDVVLGHSFGGKVALLLEPKLLVLVASAGIYVPKSFAIKAKIALFKLLKVFGLSRFRSLFVADDAKALSEEMYATFKNVVNEDFTQEFASFSGKALLFWGREDSATPLSSAEKIHSLIKNSELFVYDGDHYFFMQNGADIAKKIEKNLGE
ncbi:2-hydroxy-6-oxohepta-2,4-dienoate hydrolase [hydrothermal vent metagenome]|uniref:2-hydroxy-6-oxohepta-2,4-dienoate hydrolase n=1 Tax=hydrothermal vent metagenome TaxID=652676 RepID=A0A1W1CTR4_9ZZZZ